MTTTDLAAALLRDVPRYEPDNPLDSAPSMKDDPQGDWLSRDAVLTALSRTLDPAIAERAGKMLEGGEFDPVSMYEEALGFANGTKVPAKWALWAHSDLVRSRTLITALLAQNAALRAERDRQYDENVHRIAEQAKAEARAEAAEAKVAEYETEDGMKGAIVHAIRLLLNSHNVPAAAFIDDHVGNAIAQRDAAEAQNAALTARVEGLREERDEALAANRGLVRLNEATEARADRFRSVLEEIAEYDTGATAGLAYTALAALSATTTEEGHE